MDKIALCVLLRVCWDYGESPEIDKEQGLYLAGLVEQDILRDRRAKAWERAKA